MAAAHDSGVSLAIVFGCANCVGRLPEPADGILGPDLRIFWIVMVVDQDNLGLRMYLLNPAGSLFTRDRIRIFPAVPGEWRDVSFIDLRAEGAFVVSAWRRNGEFFRASIRSEKGMKVRLEHPCPNRNVVLRSGKSKMGRGFCPGDDICFETRIGETYVLKVEERKRAI